MIRSLTSREAASPRISAVIARRQLDVDAGIDLLYNGNGEVVIAAYIAGRPCREYLLLQDGQPDTVIAVLDASYTWCGDPHMTWVGKVYRDGYDGAPLFFTSGCLRADWRYVVGGDALEATEIAYDPERGVGLHALADNDGDLFLWLTTNGDPVIVDPEARDPYLKGAEPWAADALAHVADIRGLNMWAAADLRGWVEYVSSDE